MDAWPVCPAPGRRRRSITHRQGHRRPAYGGINLEDIAAPRCFEIEAPARGACDIPVFHDDQHGTAIVVLGRAHQRA